MGSGFFKNTGEGESQLIPTPEVVLDQFALDKSPDVGRSPQENSIDENSLIGFVMSRYSSAKSYRLQREQMWIQFYDTFRAGPKNDIPMTATEKSKVSVKVTKTKCLTALQQTFEVLYSDKRHPISAKPSRIPEGVPKEVTIEFGNKAAPPEPEPLTSPYGTRDNPLPPGATLSVLERAKKVVNKLAGKDGKVTEGSSISPTAIVVNPSEVAATKLNKRLQDQLDYVKFDDKLAHTILEMVILGAGAIKGPLAQRAVLPYWDEGGNYKPTTKYMPDINHVRVWDIYPDPSSYDITQCQYVIERHKHTRFDLYGLKNYPFFISSAIDAAVARGPNYTPEWWENQLEETNLTNIQDRFETIEFWGNVDKILLADAGLELPKEYDDIDQVAVNIWVCNNIVLKCVLNPLQPQRIPYYVIPCEHSPYSLWGVGIAENMYDAQIAMNGFIRLAIDNAALSGNAIFEIDTTMMEPGQDYSLFPGKFFRKQAGMQGQAIHQYKFDNTAQQNLAMYDKMRSVADEATFPSYASGNTGVNPSIARTSSGISMMMSAAAGIIKSMVRNLDNFLLKPLGTSLYHFNLQFDFDPELRGDIQINAEGTDAILKNEARNQQLIQMLSQTGNPAVAPWLKTQNVLRQLAKGMDFDPGEFTNTSDEALKQIAIMNAGQQSQGSPENIPTQSDGAGQALPGSPAFSAAKNPAMGEGSKAPAGQGVS